jgi:lysophospholipase L1-like esterase
MTTYRHMVIDGSSSSVDGGGAGTTSYHTTYISHAIATTDQINFATDGAILADLISRQSSVIAALSSTVGTTFLFIQGGQNDFIAGAAYASNPSGWLTDFDSYLETFRSAISGDANLKNRVKLGIATHNPRADKLHNSNRNVVDPVLLTWPRSGKCDFVVDWASDTKYGSDTAGFNASLYQDGIHPTQAGQNNMEALYFRPTLNSYPAGVSSSDV